MVDDNDIGVAMDVRVGLRVATVGSRAFAQVLDVLLIHVVYAIVSCVGFLVVAAIGPDGEAAGWALAIVVLLATLISLGWFVAYEIAWDGQTPGKRWLGLRVVTDDGRVPDAGAIVLRNAMRLVDFLPGAYLVGVVAMIFSAQGKRLGDVVAGTLVIAEEKAAAQTRRWPEGLADAEIRLLEAYFSREAALDPPDREALAERLLERLGRKPSAGAFASATLEALCPVVT